MADYNEGKQDEIRKLDSIISSHVYTKNVFGKPASLTREQRDASYQDAHFANELAKMCWTLQDLDKYNLAAALGLATLLTAYPEALSALEEAALHHYDDPHALEAYSTLAHMHHLKGDYLAAANDCITTMTLLSIHAATLVEKCEGSLKGKVPAAAQAQSTTGAHSIIREMDEKLERMKAAHAQGDYALVYDLFCDPSLK